jgi:phage terminase large subunit GpA-like protein
VASFHLNGLYAPWRRWVEIVQEFLDAKDDPEKLQVFVNTTLGESWEELLERMDAAGLAARAETYPAEVPAPVGILTGFVDVQGDRLELAIRGWGPDQESWLITHERLYGDPTKSEVWNRLDTFLEKSWQHELGGLLKLRLLLIDSGYLTEQVYAYVRPRQRRGVHATKGVDGAGRPLVGRPGKPNRFNVRVFPIGVHTAKDLLFRRLRIPASGPGYLHFCRPTSTGADGEYFAQFEAERKVRRRVHGIWTSQYVQQRDRNEAIDLEVGNLAALYLMGPAIYDHLERWVPKRGEAGAPTPPPEPARAAVHRSQTGKLARRGWVGRY